MWFWRCNFEKAKILLLASPRGGVAASLNKWCAASVLDADGVVFLGRSIGTPPRPREKWMLRDIFLIARPPLLAVMRGGEFSFLKTLPNLDRCASRVPITGRGPDQKHEGTFAWLNDGCYKSAYGNGKRRSPPPMVLFESPFTSMTPGLCAKTLVTLHRSWME